jgi:hypothetical protein
MHESLHLFFFLISGKYKATDVILHLFFLFDTEILRASSLTPNQGFMDHERLDHGSPLRLPGHGHHANGGPMDVEGWSGLQTEVFSFFSPFDTVHSLTVYTQPLQVRSFSKLKQPEYYASQVLIFY